MNLTTEDFIKSGLSPNAFLFLISMLHKEKELSTYLKIKFKTETYQRALKELESEGYIKLKEDFSWISRQKLLTLQGKIEPEREFDEFWNKYHKVTGMKKTDLQAAVKHWKKLTTKEKDLAIDNIQDYFNSLPVYNTGKPVKKARTYLADKNFNDEFDTKNSSSGRSNYKMM